VTELMVSEITGLLAPPHDEEALAVALRTLLTDTAMASRLGIAAYDHVGALGLTWSAAAQRYAELYRVLADS
jgi:glycosyltransferase involved in cell wall biosynthesis